jgi:hypothetical protein
VAALDGYLVYMLIDPRDRLPFYIGMTSRARQRWNAHHTDPASEAYHRMRELRTAGLKCRVRIMGEDLDRWSARRREQALVERFRTTLLNGEAKRLCGTWTPPGIGALIRKRMSDEEKMGE